MTKYRALITSDNFDRFFHFFAVFTGIFVVMTVIILQIMKVGVYSSVDTSLTAVATHSTLYANRTMERISSFYFDGQDFNFKTNLDDLKGKNSDQPVANTDIILFNANGMVINTFDALSNFQNFSFKKSDLNEIKTRKLVNYYGHEEKFHTITVRVHSNNYPAVAYLMAVVNVEQSEKTNERYEKIIIIIMILFWLISILASIYLANWSNKPILESYEKQKMFVENASHELRTPLAVLQNRLETLFRKPNESILDNSEAIASSLEEVRNMRILTTNLLNLARRDDGIKPEIVEISSHFFDGIFDNYKLIAEDYGKGFESVNGVTKPIRMDKSLLKQLMTILFDNAIKYTDESGFIKITVRNTDKYFFITVEDNGPGIRDADKKKIFDRFYRVDKARTRSHGGFGLGLSLAQQIVTSLKGTILVNDNKSKGSVFEVKLPLN
ncbi:sensor histidine kinase [Streptococcus pseudoporcinus]|uniref:histidine kinase n=1 Tax=Streptococcus pseudoporcinus TaxID=361101 RepID=A0A4U9XN74_9STRE|nr:HAMP domain-containing sensor histidine kinase [Streptococcus pseudoporcinus]VTS14854.1 sensor histidine kinase [Streptococcus pseudoporcinus]VUC67398.1 sensor histidine kinase [Streptococcus pseudoporcinus]VUC98325.1 sensor histidine kinase [Streptococcus pseudoporcinus]VUC98715.1 sensor histidine kinase [Streptococcus pseudoporcinus]